MELKDQYEKTKQLSDSNWKCLMDYEASSEYQMAKSKYNKLLTLWAHSNKITEGLKCAMEVSNA